jgi:ferritin-like protein
MIISTIINDLKEESNKHMNEVKKSIQDLEVKANKLIRKI